MSDTPLPELPKRYTCLRPIGEGATGEVFLARDLVMETDVAFKVVRATLAENSRFRARFFREVAIAAKVVHEHIVPVHDYGALADGRPFVALAHAERGNLRELLRRGFRIQQLLELLEQVCLGLAALHARGIIHQDLKPANILLHDGLSGEQVVWLADLGVAEEIDQIARDVRRVGGTPTYMAPEQLQGRPQELGPWTDLYALGLILFEALAGRRPHEGQSRQELLAARQKPPPPLIGPPGMNIPDELSALVQNVLDPEPRQRYDRAADLRRVLASLRQRLMRTGEGRAHFSGEKANTTLTELATEDAPSRSRSGRPTHLRWNRVPPDPLPYRVPEEPGQGGSARASLALFALREVPLVARDGVRQQVWDIARQVVAYREPRVVLLIAPRGAGATRVAESIVRTLDEGGWMEGFRMEYQRPAGPDDGYIGTVRDLMRPWNDTRQRLHERLARWLARDFETSADAVWERARTLARWCGYLLPGERPPEASVGLRLLYEELLVRSWRGGCCLMLDDAEYAEEAGDGLDLVERLLDGSVGNHAVLTLVTVNRDNLDGDPALAARIAALVALGASRIELPRLELEEVDQLLAETLTLDPALARLVAKRVQHFPTVATTVLRQAAARGILEPGPGMLFRLKRGCSLADLLPDSPEALYRQSLTSAVEATADPAAAAEALAAVALAGETPPVAVVRDLNEAGVDGLLATGLLTEEGGLLRFEQPQLQITARRLAEDLVAGDELHDRLAEAWRKHGEATGLDVDLPLGVHLLRGGHPDEAFDPLVRATRAMVAQGRHHAALRAAALAITAADSSPGKTLARAEARRLKATALLALDKAAEAERVAKEALALDANDRLLRARLLCLLAHAAIRLDQRTEAITLLGKAGYAFVSLRDKEGRADVAWGAALLAIDENNASEAIGKLRRVLDLRPSDGPLAALARTELIRLSLERGDIALARAAVESMNRAARTASDSRTVCLASWCEGLLRLAEGRREAAAVAFRAALREAAMSGERRVHLLCLAKLGEIHHLRRERDEARAQFQRCIELGERWAMRRESAEAHLRLALMHLEDRSAAAAEQDARKAAEALALRPRHPLWPAIAIARATGAARAGNEIQARQWWALARERGVDSPDGKNLWKPLSLLSIAVAEAGWTDLEDAVWEALARVPVVEES